jgi:hypothetical protein
MRPERLRSFGGVFCVWDTCDTIKKDEADKFIDHLSRHGVVTVAAKAAGISRTEAYRQRAEEKDFADRWNDAMEQAADMMEKEAIRRAYSGVMKPVWHQGAKVGSVKEYSDTLLIFLLKGARPGKFRENHRVEVSGPGGGAIPIKEIIVERPAGPLPEEES